MFHNVQSWTKICLEYIKKNTDESKYSLIVIDNGSTERISNNIKKLLDEDVVFERFDNSISVPVAYNICIRKHLGDSEYFVILHNDTLVTSGWLDRLIGHAKKIESDGDVFSAIFTRTNYCSEGTPCQNDMDIRNKFEKVKFGNKSFISYDMIVEQIKSLYEEYSGLDVYADKTNSDMNGYYKISDEISSFCTLFPSQQFKCCGGFDEDFMITGGELKLYHSISTMQSIYPIFAQDIYVHHNGNTTTDGPGKDYSSDRKNTESVYKTKESIISKRNLFSALFSTRVVSGKPISFSAIRDYGIGDIIMSLFALNGMKNKYPDIYLTYITMPGQVNFISRFKFIDRVLPLLSESVMDDPNQDRKIIKDRIEKIEKYYLSDSDFVVNWMRYVEDFDKSPKHRIEKFVSSLPLRGIDPLFPEYTIEEEDNIEVNNLLPKRDVRRVCMSPYASCKIRTIQPEVIIQILSLESKNKEIVVIGEKKTQDYIFELSKNNDNIIDLRGDLKIETIPAFLKTCDYVYTPDSGVFHLAGIAGTPTRSFFGSIDPKLRDGYYPSSCENKIYYKKELPCTPCNDIGCDEIRCMRYSKEEINKIVRGD